MKRSIYYQLKDGYWQISMEETSKKYTAFAVSGGELFPWRDIPFILQVAPATFQRALDSIIGADMEPHAFAYLDDITVIGSTFKEHMENLKEVFCRLRAANLKLMSPNASFLNRGKILRTSRHQRRNKNRSG